MLIFSKYENTFDNIFVSQPVVDINIEDSNCFIIRFPKFKRISHFILSFDAENLFSQSKSTFGYSFNLEDLLLKHENTSENGYFVLGVTSNKNRKKQYNPYPRNKNYNHAVEHIETIVKNYLPIVVSDYDVNLSSTKRIVMGASMGGLMAIKTSILYPIFENIFSFSPAFWYGYVDFIEDLKNINKQALCNLSVGLKEGDLFGDEVGNIFPTEWDLDFSNNDNFYVSGVRKINEVFQKNKIKTNYIEQSNGKHNENSWLPILDKFLIST